MSTGKKKKRLTFLFGEKCALHIDQIKMKYRAHADYNRYTVLANVVTLADSLTNSASMLLPHSSNTVKPWLDGQKALIREFKMQIK